MESKQDYQINRIIFIKEFTDEIIYNLAEEFRLKRKINVEKLKQKFLNNKTQPPKEFNNIVNHKILHPVKYRKTATIQIPSVVQPVLKKEIPDNIIKNELPKKEVIESIKPEYQEKPKELYLGKIEPILQDSMVQTIECTGPGKNILVNKYGKINVTKIILSKEEIDEIITNFSKLARIPLVEGILKAAIGNLVISAVTSELVGSRFIINRINPIMN